MIHISCILVPIFVLSLMDKVAYMAWFLRAGSVPSILITLISSGLFSSWFSARWWGSQLLRYWQWSHRNKSLLWERHTRPRSFCLSIFVPRRLELSGGDSPSTRYSTFLSSPKLFSSNLPFLVLETITLKWIVQNGALWSDYENALSCGLYCILFSRLKVVLCLYRMNCCWLIRTGIAEDRKGEEEGNVLSNKKVCY